LLQKEYKGFTTFEPVLRQVRNLQGCISDIINLAAVVFGVGGAAAGIDSLREGRLKTLKTLKTQEEEGYARIMGIDAHRATLQF